MSHFAQAAATCHCGAGRTNVCCARRIGRLRVCYGARHLPLRPAQKRLQQAQVLKRRSRVYLSLFATRTDSLASTAPTGLGQTSHLDGFGSMQTKGTRWHETVSTMTLDRLLDLRPAPNFLKVDVE